MFLRCPAPEMSHLEISKSHMDEFFGQLFLRCRDGLLVRRHQQLLHGLGMHTCPQFQHDQHADDHHDGLHEQWSLEMFTEPEFNANDIRRKQCQTDIVREAFGILRTLDD